MSQFLEESFLGPVRKWGGGRKGEAGKKNVLKVVKLCERTYCSVV